MPFKQSGAFTFAEVYMLGNFSKCNMIHIILLHISNDLPNPVIFSEIRSGSHRMVRKMLNKQAPHSLHPYWNIQFIKVRPFFVKINNFQHPVTKNCMPAFWIINVHGTGRQILNHRCDVFCTDGTPEKTVDQLGIKCDRYVWAILLIFHLSRVCRALELQKNNIAFIQMKWTVIHTVMHGTLFYIGNLYLRMVVPHKGIGLILRKPLVTDKKRKIITAMLFNSFWNWLVMICIGNQSPLY